MVCLGNICRSPLAEGIMRQKLMIYGLKAKVDSAGTSAWHIGQKPDTRARSIARLHGIDISTQRARQFLRTDFDRFDLIYAMDKDNYSDILSLVRNKEDKRNVSMLLNELYPGEFRSVPDPYFGGDEGFKSVYRLLDEACEKAVHRLKDM